MKNKGITLVELIISISLISVVVIFIFQLLVDVRYNNNKTDYARENQQKRALIIKTIQDDFLDYGLIGLNDNGSTATKLVVNFNYNDSKTGELIVESDSVSYKKANGEIEVWPLEKMNDYMKYNVRCVSYIKVFENEGEFFSIKFRIPLEVKKDSKNTLDDLEFFYIGEKNKVSSSNFKNALYLGSYNANYC